MERITEQIKEETKAEPRAEKPPVTRAQRGLLLGVLAIGILAELVLNGRYGSTDTWMGVFWLVALAVFVFFQGKSLAGNKTALAVGIPAALFAAALAAGCVDDSIADWLYLATPAAMMTFAVFATQEIPAGREGIAALGVVRGLVIKPFSAIPDFFRAIGTLRGGRGSTARRLGIGLLAGLPVLAVVLVLLSSADGRMRQLLGTVFSRFDVALWLWRALRVMLVAALFYSLFYNLVWGKRDRLPEPVQKTWEAAAPAVVIGMLLAAYALFGYVQFGYFFGGALPIELTYSEYAVSGFNELILVTLINVTVLGVCLVKARPTQTMRAFELLLLVASALLLASAAWRLLLYIGAYGLTIRRVLGLWVMCYVAFLLAAAGVRVFREGMKLMRVSSFALLYWYLALNCVPWDALIRAWNLASGA